MPSFYAPPGNLDVDTPLSEHSLDAATDFCGYGETETLLDVLCCVMLSSPFR